MTRRLLIPILLSVCFFTEAFAQIPTAINAEAQVGTPNFSSVVCPIGVSAFAGTSTQTLFQSAQSNDVQFLCINDSMDIDHLGGQTFGDPAPGSAPGISYVFYNCQPTVSGPDLATLLTDPCLITNPPPGGSGIWGAQTGVAIDGDATFFNNGALQSFFNNDNPIELWYAPVTLDDFATFGFESDGIGGPSGPCINVNVADAFSVVYLNEIQASNINPTADGPCTGSFFVEGGLPEYDGTFYTFSIELATNPAITGEVLNINDVTHGETVQFLVPQPGIYNVIIEDGKSCGASFTVDMSACITVTTIAGDEVVAPGNMICVPITAADFNAILSFQYTISYDPAVLMFNTINTLNIADILFSGSGGNINVIWFDDNNPPLGITVPDGTVLYEICFTAIGPLGSTSPITFSGDNTPIEISMADGANSSHTIGAEFNNGSVTINNSAFTVDFTSCSTVTNTGSFTISTIGGVAPFNFAWVQQGNPGNNGMGTIPDGQVTGLPPGTYDVVVTDGVGDVETGSVTIVNAASLFAQLTFVNPTCPGGTDGSVTVNFSGGIAPYEIDWSNGATGVSTIGPPLSEGMYSVTVTDDLGCSSTASTNLGVAPIGLTGDIQHITCAIGGNSGAITVETTGGNDPFTFVWDNGETTPQIMNLAAGEYCVTATDFNNCSVIGCYTVNEPISPMILSFDSVSVACPNDMSGELTVIVQPGNNPNISYQWDANANNQTTQTAFNLNAGMYSVTVSDADGCSTEETVSLAGPPALVIDTIVTSPNCPEQDNGQIQLLISGGTTPYMIQWENGSNFPVLPSLTCNDSYSVVISDANGCETIEMDIEVPCPQAIVITLDTFNIQGVSCHDGIPCDGQVTAFASGGTSGGDEYNYTWSSGESISNSNSGSIAMQLCQGDQSLEVNDGLCSVTVQLTGATEIPAPPPLTFDFNNGSTGSTPVSCFGDTDGSAVAQATGGTGGTDDYIYQWANPSTSGQMITDLAPGDYTVMVTDLEGCTESIQIQVGEPPLLVADIVADQSLDVTCAGGEDGQIAVTWDGGNAGNATYAWSPNVSNESTAHTLPIGTYSVTVTDSKGCSDEVQYTINEPTPIVAEIPAPVEPLCNGDQTVVTIDTAYGGNSIGHLFSVDFGPKQFITNSIPILAGPHTIQVFDTSGCFTEYSIDVDQPAPVTALFSEDVVTVELGDSIRLNPLINSPNAPIDTILWDPVIYLSCTELDSLCKKPWIKPLETLLYELTVIDTNGCVGTDEILVDIDKNRNVFIPNAFSPNGDSSNEIFKVYTGHGVAEVNYFQIYDRWGEKLYEDTNFLPGDNYLEGWDGRFNGKDMNSGVYIFMAQVRFVDDVVLLYRGDVTLIR